MKTPRRTRPEDRRRRPGPAAGRRHRGAFVQRRPLGADGARIARARAGPARWNFRPPVRFSLFRGPGFSVERRRHPRGSLHRRRAHRLCRGRHGSARRASGPCSAAASSIASIRLDGASINLTKSGPAAEPGRWNFASFVNRSVMSAAPAIHVRNSRINFKFGDTKSVFYLTETDLDICAARLAAGGGWSVSCSAKPARTDRTAQGLGSFTLQGPLVRGARARRSRPGLERTGLGELTALLRGQSGSVHGTHLLAPAPGRAHRQHRHPGTRSPSRTCTAGTCCRPEARAGRSTSTAA